jgi:hypothetical protein
MTFDNTMANINTKKNIAEHTEVSGSVSIRKICRRHDIASVDLVVENDFSRRDLSMNKRLERSLILFVWL